MEFAVCARTAISKFLSFAQSRSDSRKHVMQGEVDTTAFNAMCKNLSRIVPGVPELNIVKAEASRVLHRASTLAPVAKAASIRKKVKTGYYVRLNGRSYYLGNIYPDALWDTIQAAKKALLQSKLKARGLARQSWYLAALRMGKGFDAPAYVKSAVASTGKAYPENIGVTVQESGAEVSIIVTNSQPTINRLPNSEPQLNSALESRVIFYERNLKAGVFEKIEKIAAKYKGFYTA